MDAMGLIDMVETNGSISEYDYELYISALGFTPYNPQELYQTDIDFVVYGSDEWFKLQEEQRQNIKNMRCTTKFTAEDVKNAFVFKDRNGYGIRGIRL